MNIQYKRHNEMKPLAEIVPGLVGKIADAYLANEVKAAVKVAQRAASETSVAHDWFRPSFLSFDCCRICGIVRRADDKNSPCKGAVKIALRDGEASVASNSSEGK